MIKDQNQESGDNSTNLQGKTIIINQGITYADAKLIALDVFKANFLELSALAKETAKARADELIDNFLKELEQRAPESLNNLQDPGMQYAIFTAQREYAKTGDKDLAKLLVDILVDRSKETERDLKQIVLNESLNVAPKLTGRQLDTLTVIFLSKYSVNYDVLSLESLGVHLEEYKPFIPSLSKDDALYQHLEFTGCGSLGLGTSKLTELFQKQYTGMFQKGFTREEIEKQLEQPMDSFPNLVVACHRDKSKFQISALNSYVIDEHAQKLGLSGVPLQKLKVLMSSNIFSTQEVNDDLIRQCPEFAALLEVWENSDLKRMTLTSVGIALAQANFRAKTGITVDLGIWINDK